MMIFALMLFGLDLQPLVDSIAAVESSDGRRSSNVYQITPVYVRDCNRFHPVFTLADRFSRDRSQTMMQVYWAVYGKRYADLTGNQPTYEVLARIHNGGPDGFKRRSTDRYWQRVKRELDKRIGGNHVAP